MAEGSDEDVDSRDPALASSNVAKLNTHSSEGAKRQSRLGSDNFLAQQSATPACSGTVSSELDGKDGKKSLSRSPPPSNALGASLRQEKLREELDGSASS